MPAETATVFIFFFALKPPYFCSIDQEPLKKPFLKVSLLQLKNQVNPYRKQLSQFLAFLLLGLFVNAMVIEGLHHHNSQDQFSSCKSALDKTQGDTQLHSAKVNCKLCEVIKHQSQFYNLPSVVSPVLAPVETAKPVFSYLPPHPTAYILAAANKGPPSNLA
ncbi:hypothetical protein N180_20490 [Pedobacter antarcticus 4BY]|uniref:DUF2946 domain-containing protein n=1 Tax=Pedobacter antarcticus 4BY TaxID=1358423 RepID=A0A081PG50_9SPHI|nr:hypothetical protein N180_20490 [Pedobacter antarcticus 4BY]